MSDRHLGGSNPNPQDGYEKQDLRVSVLFAGLMGTLALLGGASLAMFGLFIYLQPDAQAPAEVEVPPLPYLETTSGEEIRQTRRKDEQRLNHYHWIDRETGTVAIPIDVAMELLLERGLPAVETRLVEKKAEQRDE